MAFYAIIKLDERIRPAGSLRVKDIFLLLVTYLVIIAYLLEKSK
jgi:hypothetical protein